MPYGMFVDRREVFKALDQRLAFPIKVLDPCQVSQNVLGPEFMRV